MNFNKMIQLPKEITHKIKTPRKFNLFEGEAFCLFRSFNLIFLFLSLNASQAQSGSIAQHQNLPRSIQQLRKVEVFDDLEWIGEHRETWPDDHRGFIRNLPSLTKMTSPECREFQNFVTNNKQDDPFATHQLAILKNGQIVFEWYKPNHFTADHTSSLYSASKSVSATVIGAAIQAGMTTPTGEKLSLETRIADFFGPLWRPPSGHSSIAGIDVISQPRLEKFYQQIRLKHLLMMSSGIRWSETSLGDPNEETYSRMIFGRGAENMLFYSLRQPMEGPPGQKWNYSGGNTMIMMGMLSRLKGITQRLYAQLPWSLLFNPIHMANVAFERDLSGYFIGNSYVYMGTEEMLRFGYLYLNGGFWKNERILPPGWVTLTQQLSPSLTHPSQQNSYETIKNEGVYGATGFWLNKDVPGNWTIEGKRIDRFQREFKNSPHSLFMAAGHFGQMIIMIPSDDMVIARTGGDPEYWSKIDRVVHGAIQCFGSQGLNHDQLKAALQPN